MSDDAFTVSDLVVEVVRDGRMARAVDGVSFSVAPGTCLGLVGESGCGKSLTLRAMTDVLPRGARASGVIDWPGVLERCSITDAKRARGRGVSMIFQEPMTALNPLMTAGDLVGEGLRARGKLDRRETEQRIVALMSEVGIPDPKRRAKSWPHELSGGLRQRIMIAMALATNPRLLLADEPTTALDVTVQDQILGLLDRLRTDRSLATILVTHDLAVVHQVAQTIAVMYAGRIVETGPTQEVLTQPKHPYTQGLVRSMPSLDAARGTLATIAGLPPAPEAYPTGCRFAPRCSHVQPECRSAPYLLEPVNDRRSTACIRWASLEDST